MTDEQQQIDGLPEGATLRPVQPTQPAASDLSQVEGLPEGATLRPINPPAATPVVKAPTAPTAPHVHATPTSVVKGAVAPPAPKQDLLTQADEGGFLPPDQALVAKAARGVRGLYHGVMGDEESTASKGQTTTASPEAANLGFTPEHVGYKAGEMLHGVGKFIKEGVQDLAGNAPLVVPDKGDTAGWSDPKAHTLMSKYITAPSAAEREASEKEMEEYFKSQGPAAAGHAISAFLHGTLGEYIPAVGPLAMSLESQAQKGDIGGALAQIASLYAFEKGTGALKAGIKDRVNAKVEELNKTPEVKQAEDNVQALAKVREAAEAKHKAAMAEHNKYQASHAQGIGSPEKIVNEVNKAKDALDEAEAHHEFAKEDLAKKRAEQPTIPQQLGGSVGRAAAKVLPIPAPTPEIPTENVETAPVLMKLGERAPAKPVIAPINVKTPGQVQPETFPQEPKPAPRASYGRIALAGDQGVMGKPLQLTEGTPEGPKVPAGGLPKINLPEPEAPKPQAVTAADMKTLKAKEGKVIDTDETPEGRIGKLLQEALKADTGTNKNFPAANVEESPAKVEKNPVEDRSMDRRVADEEHTGDERRKAERRVLNSIQDRTFREAVFGGGEKGIDTDAYAKATEQARKELGPDATKEAVIARRNELVSPEAKGVRTDVGERAREINPEPTRAETKGKPVLPKEEQTGYAAKKEEIVPAGVEGRESAKSASEYHPVVEQKVNELSDENLKKLAKAHGLNPDEYDFKARDERRHRTERDQLSKDITEQIGEDEKINLGRAAEQAEKEPGFANRDQSAKARADRAAKLFPRLRGPVDEYGNPKVSGGAPDTVGTKEAADKDTEHFANAKKELGANVSISDVAKRAQEMKDAAAKTDLKRIVTDYNKKEGLGPVKDNKLEVDPRGKEIARAYDDMKHDPSNPEVKKSYAALIDDAKKQWDALTKAGIKLEPQDEDPYKSYDEMKKDFNDNKRLKVFRGGEELPEDHPLAKVDPKTGETYNVMFRAVHDAIGHLLHDNDFSEKGESNAFDTHRQTMSKEAIPAMTTETKAQVASFFNHDQKFPEQKAGILPERFIEDAPDPKAVLDHLKSGKDYALLTAENPNNERATPEQNAQKNREMKAYLEKMGYKPTPIEGHVKDVEGQKENSFFVPDISPKDAAKVSRKFGQASVMTKQGIHDLVKDTVHPSTGVMEGDEAAKQDYHSTVAGKPFSIGVDFDKEEDPQLPNVSGGSQSAGAAEAKEKATPESLKKTLPDLAQQHLTQEEKESLTTTATGKARTAGTQKFIQNMEKIPTVQEYVDIAKQGEGARKWYSRSTAAFDAMHEEAPEYFKKGDKEKFMGVLAGSSPQQSVAMNLRETLGFWKEWNDAGRPQFDLDKWKEFGDEARKAWEDDGSPRSRGKASGASMHWDYAPTGTKWKAENLLLKNLTLPETKVPNIIKALNGEPMWPDLTKNQAFKAPSFAENLKKWIDGKSTGTKHVTNDSWMGLFGGIDKSALSKPENYHPLSVATRAAAEELGWEPEEAQAAIWSFTQALTERGTEDPELVQHYSEDFKDLLANDLETRDLLKDLGVNLDQLDSKLETIGEKPQVSGRGTPTTAHSVGQLRDRIEVARGKGAIPEPKSVQGNLFKENPAFEYKANPGAGHTIQPRDEATRFEPSDFENEDSGLAKLGEKKKKSPLGNLR